MYIYTHIQICLYIYKKNLKSQGHTEELQSMCEHLRKFHY